MSSPASPSAPDASFAALLAAAPPRKLPPALRRIALRQAAPLSFAFFGAVFGGFGLLLVLKYFPQDLAGDLRLQAADTSQANGYIVSRGDDARLSLNKTKVVRYAFNFRTNGGLEVNGLCYTTGRPWQMGDAVSVLYRRENPALACPVGARLSKSGLGYVFVALFPLIGIGLVTWVTVSRRRALALFRRGQVLEVLVTDIEHTQTMVNDYPIYKITLERANVRTELPLTLRQWKPKVVSFLQTRMIAKKPVLLLADPRDPAHFLLPETL